MCYQGLEAAPALLQLGLCAVWVYGVMRNFALLGVLAWYSDVAPGASFMQQLLGALAEDAAFILPALGLHMAFAAVRPGLLLCLVQAESSRYAVPEHLRVGAKVQPQ